MKFPRSTSRRAEHVGAPSSVSTRREFLGRVGAGAAGAAVLGTLGGIDAVAAAEVVPSTSPLRFGRMFPKLPPFAPTPILTSAKLKDALVDIAKPGGLLDAQDDLTQGPIRLITEANLSLNNRNNPTHTAGTTFMGQFMDHDMTFDIGSPLGIPTDPESATNGRTPTFDLDSVYGFGPTGSPQLYGQDGDPVKLKIEFGGLHEDLPRNPDNSAIIADPRNDENIIIAGLQCAFILFHNHAVDVVRGQGVSDNAQAFAQARQLTTWHYHWMIVHEFLPLFIGPSMVNAITTQGRRFYKPALGQAFIPVEFQGSVYRFGHSMVRPSYRANFTGGPGGTEFFGLIFDPAAEQANPSDPDDLSGRARAPRRFVGWHTFFDFGDGRVKPNKTIDRRLSTPLFNLPLTAIASGDPPPVLPERTLLRHITWSLPSGQSVAQAIGVQRIPPNNFNELKDYGLDLTRNTPLFYYALAEAELLENGLHLGPVGGTIVGEVILGLLQTDPASYLVANPSWTPTLPAKYSTDGGFRMIDFLAFAGVDAQR
jgi:hypothetical protein